MSDEEKVTQQTVTRQTTVDLGTDLIEEAPDVEAEEEGRRSQKPELPDTPLNALEIEDRLESARILLNEGLVDEAKKVLHRLLFSDPKNAFARKQLEEIHELELKQIFGEERPRRQFRFSSDSSFGEIKQEADPRFSDIESIIDGLDRDLELGIRSDPRSTESAAGMLDVFTKTLENQLKGTSIQDRIDLGIGFLEMDLPEVAARQFEYAIRQSGGDRKTLISATQLLANAHIASRRFHLVTSCLQPILMDAEIPKAEKIDLIYLMGRAYEALRQMESAARWYQEAYAIDPRYRDVEDRLQVHP